MKQLTCVLSDIRYLTFKRLFFGETKVDDSNKFHVLRIDKKDGFITYSLGRLNADARRYFRLTDAYSSIYEGNSCKLPEKVKIHVSCDGNRPHYTSEHNSTDSNFKCHAGALGGSCGRYVPEKEQKNTICFLKRLYYDTVSRNITSMCGGIAKFNAEGRNKIERNENILGRIKLLNPSLHQNLVNYTSQENSMYDPNGTNGIKVPNLPDFQPNTATNYTAQGPRRSQLPESERDIRIREQRAEERKIQEEKEELKQQEELRLIKEEEIRVLNLAAREKSERRLRRKFKPSFRWVNDNNSEKGMTKLPFYNPPSLLNTSSSAPSTPVKKETFIDKKRPASSSPDKLKKRKLLPEGRFLKKKLFQD